MTKDTNNIIAASLMAISALNGIETKYSGNKRYVAAKHDPLTKKQSKGRNKSKNAKQARKKNRK